MWAQILKAYIKHDSKHFKSWMLCWGLGAWCFILLWILLLAFFDTLRRVKTSIQAKLLWRLLKFIRRNEVLWKICIMTLMHHRRLLLSVKSYIRVLNDICWIILRFIELIQSICVWIKLSKLFWRTKVVGVRFLNFFKLAGLLNQMRNSSANPLERTASLNISIIALMHSTPWMYANLGVPTYRVITSATGWAGLCPSNPIFTIEICSLLLQLVIVSHYMRHDPMSPQSFIVPCIIFNLYDLVYLTAIVVVIILSFYLRRRTAENFIEFIQGLQFPLLLHCEVQIVCHWWQIIWLGNPFSFT